MDVRTKRRKSDKRGHNPSDNSDNSQLRDSSLDRKKKGKKLKKDKETPVKLPNANELGSRPKNARIAWMAFSYDKEKEEHNLHMGASWEGLQKAQLKKGPLSSVLVMDFKTLEVIELTGSDIEKFMLLWKENYLNPDFGIKKLRKKLGLDKS